MGGMDWAALPLVADILGAEDIERLVREIVAIRDFQAAERSP